MKVRSIPSEWMRQKGRRLDCGPYFSGGVEARLILESLRVPKQPLRTLTQGGMEGIFHAGREARAYVTALEYGVPFLSSSSFLRADISDLPLLSKKQVDRNPRFRIQQGWTLISRSGTIGRTVYARPDMDGLACSEHVMRVVPDSNVVYPGYLFAYLSSRFGLPQVMEGVFGAIIQSLSPEHIGDLMVPLLGEKIERQVHNLVQQAAEMRSEASTQRTLLINHVTELLRWRSRPLDLSPNVTSSSNLLRRMDAFHHSTTVQDARDCLKQHDTSSPIRSIVGSVFEPNRGARRKVESTVYGIPFLSSSAVFCLDPRGEYLISKNTPNLPQLLVHEADVLIPRSGQVGGLIGRAVLPLPSYRCHTASEHLVRIRCASERDAYVLWSVLVTEPGYYALVGTAFGTSIPSLDCSLIRSFWVPWFDESKRNEIVARVHEIQTGLSTAISCEREAITLLETAISALAAD